MLFPMFPMFPMMIGASNDLISNNMKPVRLYRLMQSIVNFDRDIPVSTYDLSKYARIKIFDFDYPLSQNIEKETFETNILNHFINRRIGFQTPTAFKIALNSKLNEIMPMYNNMFDMVSNWGIFKNGDEEFIEENHTFIENFIGLKQNDNKRDSKKDNTQNENNIKNSNGTASTTGSNSQSITGSGSDTNVETGSVTKDIRNSAMPQSEISNVQDADYLTNYTLETDTFNNHTNARTLSNTESVTGSNSELNDIVTKESEDNLKETSEKTNSNETLKENTNNEKSISENYTKKVNRSNFKDLDSYIKFVNEIKSIYSLIYKDLDDLFLEIY